MNFQSGDEVVVISSEFHPNTVGKTGVVIDEAPPFNGVWSVEGPLGWFIDTFVGCAGYRAHEIRKV
ncbi:hypothetical protein [Streptomyces sp. NPDC048309]|uniref:hypothetical protein n=1 Tax=Streptomyces sp. NPDC048309 TaxID=3154618 RepID=UPI0033E0BC8B